MPRYTSLTHTQLKRVTARLFSESSSADNLQRNFTTLARYYLEQHDGTAVAFLKHCSDAKHLSKLLSAYGEDLTSRFVGIQQQYIEDFLLGQFFSNRPEVIYRFASILLTFWYKEDKQGYEEWLARCDNLNRNFFSGTDSLAPNNSKGKVLLDRLIEEIYADPLQSSQTITMDSLRNQVITIQKRIPNTPVIQNSRRNHPHYPAYKNYSLTVLQRKYYKAVATNNIKQMIRTLKALTFLEDEVAQTNLILTIQNNPGFFGRTSRVQHLRKRAKLYKRSGSLSFLHEYAACYLKNDIELKSPQLSQAIARLHLNTAELLIQEEKYQEATAEIQRGADYLQLQKNEDSSSTMHDAAYDHLSAKIHYLLWVISLKEGAAEETQRKLLTKSAKDGHILARYLSALRDGHILLALKMLAFAMSETALKTTPAKTVRQVKTLGTNHLYSICNKPTKDAPNECYELIKRFILQEIEVFPISEKISLQGLTDQEVDDLELLAKLSEPSPWADIEKKIQAIIHTATANNDESIHKRLSDRLKSQKLSTPDKNILAIESFYRTHADIISKIPEERKVFVRIFLLLDNHYFILSNVRRLEWCRNFMSVKFTFENNHPNMQEMQSSAWRMLSKLKDHQFTNHPPLGYLQRARTQSCHREAGTHPSKSGSDTSAQTMGLKERVEKENLCQQPVDTDSIIESNPLFKQNL